jgi:serine/threonine protein phosphatase PrpC
MIENKGCTANVVLVKDGTIYVANAGDARCVAAIGGKAVALSTDHKPTLSKEKQRVIKAGFSVNGEGRIDGNLNLSRSLGDLKYKKNKKLKPSEQAITAFPDVKAVPSFGGPGKKVDFLVIGCDGVWEMKTSQQIVTYIYEYRKKKVPLKKIAETLLDSLLSPNIQRTMGKGCDNMSLIIVEFSQ